MHYRVHVELRALTCATAVVLGLVQVLVGSSSLGAQTTVSVDGEVESTTGGFKFPDGTVQTTAVFLGSAPVEDSGQKECWDGAGDPLACSGSGQDGELQRGVDWPGPRFTDNGDGTVSDNLTNLIWLKMADCFGTRTWEQALGDANALMSGQCDLTDGSVATDWRLPNIKELLTLVDYGEESPALPIGHPFTSVQSAFYWSSTSAVTGTHFAWGVDLIPGSANGTNKVNSNLVWPVRGGS